MPNQDIESIPNIITEFKKGDVVSLNDEGKYLIKNGAKIVYRRVGNVVKSDGLVVDILKDGWIKVQWDFAKEPWIERTEFLKKIGH